MKIWRKTKGYIKSGLPGNKDNKIYNENFKNNVKCKITKQIIQHNQRKNGKNGKRFKSLFYVVADGNKA